jgi:hypothetical protein
MKQLASLHKAKVYFIVKTPKTLEPKVLGLKFIFKNQNRTLGAKSNA